jgi:hypothetical protein
MKRVLKWLGLLLLGLLLGAVGVGAYHWDALSSFPALPSSYEAKELCSCLFVEGRPQADCEKFIRQDVVGIDGRDYDMQQKTVTVRALWTENRARFVSPRLGCALE